MKFKAEIKLDNAAFEDNPEELSDILKGVAVITADYRASYAIGGKLEHPSRFISDSNGNLVGHWEIVE